MRISAYLEEYHLKPKAPAVLYNRIKDLTSILGNSILFDAVRLCSTMWYEERWKVMLEYLESRENRTVTTGRWSTISSPQRNDFWTEQRNVSLKDRNCYWYKLLGWYFLHLDRRYRMTLWVFKLYYFFP